MADLNKIKEKILKLRAMIPDRGATEGEALAALIKADALMEEHNLSEKDLDLAEAKRDMRSGEFKYGIKTQHPCAKWCSKTIGEFCGVITWWSPTQTASNGFGFNADVEMYEFLLKLVHDTMNREWKDFLSTNPKRPGISRHTEYWSFMLGISTVVNKKLNDLMSLREVVTDSTGTDLVFKKQAVVEAGIKEMLPSLRLKMSSSRGISADGNALGKGQEAGGRINLSRPLKSGPGGRKQIA